MLTTRFVATVKPTDTRTDYADAQVTGLCLRVTPQGAKSWSLRYRTKDGRPRRLTLGDADTVPLANARRLAKIALLHVAEGRDPMQERQDAKRGDTLDRLFNLYLEQHAKPRKRSWKDDERMYKAEWRRTLGATKVKDITRRDVRRVLEAIVKRGSPITANRAQALIKVMLNFAVDQEWIGASPVSRMPKLTPERSRDRVLTHDEIRLLWRVSELEPPVYAAYTKLRLLTAQRGGELAKLKWSDFEADSFTIPAEISKNKQAHRVPLSKQAKAVLKTIPVVNDWVFPGQHDIGPMKDLRQATERIIQRIETAKWIQAGERFDFRGHDLRRTAATLMASVGVPTEHISRVLNHSDGTPKVTAVYQRYEFDKEKRSALDALGREIDRILSGSLATTSHK